MKILHINTSDTAGGAAIAAMRLHNAMLVAGIDSTFLCLSRNINDDETILSVDLKTKFKSRSIDAVQRRLFGKCLSEKKGTFSNMKYGYKLSKFVDLSKYDIIYIHWINSSFLSLQGLEEICKTGKKIYWFMHDMFPITGGCHYSFDCKKYCQNCGECPYLKSSGKHDFSYKQLRIKHKILDKYSNLSFIAPSKWLYKCTKESSLGKNHKIYHIPNLLDSTIFHTLDKKLCREILNLPKDKKIILFGADSALSNPYKGFEYLVEALKILEKDSDVNNTEIELVIFGSSYNKNIEEMLPFKTHFMGYLHDSYTLALLYNSADVFCIPSLAENFANTILESVHCGTPVVGFDVGGIPDVVNDKTGYLAKYRDSEDFARGIKIVLNSIIKINIEEMKNYKTNILIETHKELWR